MAHGNGIGFGFGFGKLTRIVYRLLRAAANHSAAFTAQRARPNTFNITGLKTALAATFNGFNGRPSWHYGAFRGQSWVSGG